jgi:hypothetical protein
MDIPENIVIKPKLKRTRKPKVVLPIEKEEDDNDIPYTEEEKNKIWLDFCGGKVVDYSLIDTLGPYTKTMFIEETKPETKPEPRVIKLDKREMTEKEQIEFMENLVSPFV